MTEKDEKMRITGHHGSAIKSTSSKSIWRLGGLALFAIAVAGCSSSQQQQAALSPYTYQQRHPIVVDTLPTSLDLPVASKKTHFTDGMKSAVAGFARGYRKSGAKGVKVLIPRGSSSDHEASHTAGHARSLLVKAGVPKHHITTTTYTAQSDRHPGHVRLVYHSVKARVASECGVWPTNIAIDFKNENYENFGCATQSNLAAIVADPNDLISPRGPGAINPTRTDAVIDSFESGEPVAITPVSSQSLQ